MAFALGVLLFALGIAASIALHEYGHMKAARMTGMRVRRYFIGFGPTIWSTTRGHTEYGIKTIPLGGFCDIAGMTKLDEMTDEERPYAMYDRPAAARIFVMLGGIIMNLILAAGITYGVAVAWGLPDRSVVMTATVAETQCVPATQHADGTLDECEGEGPAAASGLKVGDTIRSVDGTETPDFQAFRTAIADKSEDAVSSGASAGETITLPTVVEREGRERTIDLNLELVRRLNTAGNEYTTGAVGIRAEVPEYRSIQYNPATAVVGTAGFLGDVTKQTAQALWELPQRVPGVVHAIFGGNRDDNSPMSVVGASRVGGELVQYEQWMTFFMVLAQLNLFLAAFNLIPLPPLDGGHIAVVLWEKLRDLLRRLRGLEPGGPADYTKLLPITYAATAVLILFGGTVIVADIVNPIRLF